MGLLKGIDTVYIKVITIGGEKSQVNNVLRGRFTPLNANYYVFNWFVRLADFDFFLLAMAKIGPAVWAILTVMTLPTLL